MIYHIYANQSNIGDWLSAKGIQHLLQPLPVMECLCDEPFIEETMDKLSNATENDLIIIGGGGLLMDYFIPFWEAFDKLAGRVPFCVWGIGYCDIKHENSRPPGELLERILRKSKLCIVRDEVTRSYLPRLELPAPVPCPSINVIERRPDMEEGILHVANYTTATAATYDAMSAEARDFANAKIIPYRETNNRIEKGSERELEKTLAFYERSEYVVSSALHGCIIAVAMGRKVLAVSGDRKIEGFMDAVGLGDWVVDYDHTEEINPMLLKLPDQPYPEFAIGKVRSANEIIAGNVKNLLESRCQ